VEELEHNIMDEDITEQKEQKKGRGDSQQQHG